MRGIHETRKNASDIFQCPFLGWTVFSERANYNFPDREGGKMVLWSIWVSLKIGESSSPFLLATHSTSVDGHRSLSVAHSPG